MFGIRKEHIDTTSEAIKIIKERKVRMNPIYRIWYGMSEPRIVTVLQTMFYIMALCYGIRQILTFESFPEEFLTIHTGILVSLTFIIGGSVGMLSAPRGFWQFERAGIVLIITGFAIHMLWTILDPTPGIRWGQVFRLASCIVFLMIRYSTISWARMDPEK